ncbi:hypothetical protein HII31_06988 [Pseudocercospora fuligena]|uniref:Uncharacterized protein n=1 Tax=Pseudocercospora fuligena TaxID=685502 RepID=A0A8H6RI38_9PEZI|nr:hypothetical protein HII31_06988 [Pseudocercospora fuligena]
MTSEHANQSGEAWVAQLDREKHLPLVSSLYGPGAVGCWLAIVGSVFVSWTLNRKLRKNDKISNDFLGALTLPIVAAGHLLHQLLRYPGPLATMFGTFDPTLTPKVAALEASLSVCQTFTAMALPLAAVPMYMRKPKRFFAVTLTGLFCFAMQISSTLLSPVPPLDETNLSRAPLVHGTAFTAVLTSAIALLVIAATCVWIQLAIMYRASRRLREQQANVAELATLEQRLQDAMSCDDPSSVASIQAEILSRKQKTQLTQEACLGQLTGLATLFLPCSLAASFFGTQGVTLLGRSHSLIWSLRFFIPESNTSITELDQMVALVGGMAALGFSCYEAYKSWLADGQ